MNVFTLDKCEDGTEQIDIDELYETKRNSDLNKLALYKKMLNRIHVRIKTTSHQRTNNRSCWFVVPEMIIGVPRYDHAACIAYLLHALENNGFRVKYFHPNTLFICWEHWVPTYVRNEIRKKTGIVVNEFGETVQETQDENEQAEIINEAPTAVETKNKKQYTPIQSYRPSGKLVYSEEMINQLGQRL